MLSIMEEWTEYKLEPLNDYEKRVTICGQSNTVPAHIDAILLKSDLAEIGKSTTDRYNQGSWPALYFTSKGKGGIACKRYLDDMGGRIVTNLWKYDDVGHTDEATKVLKAIFHGKAPFETSKPPRLIEQILQIASDPDSIILDSFAGSGTTAHAVLNMNKADGGHRKFILIEMEDYAERITAERVRRVINGYGEGKNAVEGTGGDFAFYELGQPLLIGNCLNEAVGAEKIREYVWYTETRRPFAPPGGGNPYYLGAANDTGYYFYYEPQQITVLDHPFLATVTERMGETVIYADRCALSAARLKQLNITFKKIPRDISRL
jgi:adenine-specific DNA-methyltransferase